MVSIILSAAKAAQVSGALLLAICTHESGLKNVKVPHDGGSPTYGICQVKFDTAKMLGFKGKADDLMIPAINAEYAAKYLKYQIGRYGDQNWCVLSGSYNAGSFLESSIKIGHPKNFIYVQKVKRHLNPLFHFKMECIQ